MPRCRRDTCCIGRSRAVGEWSPAVAPSAACGQRQPRWSSPHLTYSNVLSGLFCSCARGRQTVLRYPGSAFPLPQVQACFTLVLCLQAPNQETVPNLMPPCSSGGGVLLPPPAPHPPLGTLGTGTPLPSLSPSSSNPCCLPSVCQCVLQLPAPTSSCHSLVICLSLVLLAWHHRKKGQGQVD